MNFLKKLMLPLGIVAALSACKTYESVAEKKFQDKGFTKEQSEVLAAEGYKQLFTTKIAHEDGTQTYDLTYRGIGNTQILAMNTGVYGDLKRFNEYDGSIITQKYLNNSRLGAHLKYKEGVFQYIHEVYNQKDLKTKFTRLLQNQSDSTPYDPYRISPDERYSIATLFPKKKKFDFDAKYVKTARKAKKLENPKLVVEEIEERQKYYEEVKNPDYPIKDKQNEYIFKEIRTGLRVISYNLDADSKKEADYIEMYRLDADGNAESKPAIKVFKTNGAGSLEVLIADKDFEGEKGYGNPDYVFRVPNINAGSDILYSEGLINLILPNLTKVKKEMPDILAASHFGVTKAGSLLMENYELKETGGWESHLPDYKTGKNARKYLVHAKLSGNHHNEFANREIQWIAKQYLTGSRVVEFYKPKKNL